MLVVLVLVGMFMVFVTVVTGEVFKKCVSPGATDNDKSRFYHQIHRWDHRTLDSSQDILKYRRWQLQD